MQATVGGNGITEHIFEGNSEIQGHHACIVVGLLINSI